jgi:DNA-directed RNA polymerase subunit RPC12/RpoP
MKDKTLKHKEDKPCSVKYAPAPEFVTCPNCGFEIELWLENEETTRCMFCGHKVFKRETTVH